MGEPVTVPRPPRSRPWLSPLVKTVFFGAIGVALCWYFLTVDWSALHGVTFRPGLLALALVVALAFRYLGVVVWRLVLRQLGADALPPLPVLADIYAKAWLARYIPGTLPWIAGKVYLAAEHGIAKTKLAVSSVVEAGAQVVGVGALSLALLALDGRIADVAPFIRVVAVVGALALACVMLPPVFNRMIHLGARLVRRDIQVSVSWRGVGSPVALYAVGAVVSGLSYVAFSHAIITNLTWGDTAYLIGAFGLAGVVGMLTPLVPSGLGTRDSAQLLLLLVILPVPEAALLVLASRVWSALVDVVFWAVAAVHRSASKP